jgi:glycosyltransferase involved in cell wall biosynthesis
MATKILDLELSDTKKTIRVDARYDAAYVVLRAGAKPIAIEHARVCDGLLDLGALKKKVLAKHRKTIWTQYVARKMCAESGDRPKISKPGVSATVAVCTRERPEDLKMCLDALMRLVDDGQEYLIVDNAPVTHATRHLVAKYPRARYVCQPLVGLDRARNMALQEARHDIVAFCDDDAVPDAGWLRALCSGFCDPLVLGVTGLTLPYELETRAQEWFERYAGFSKGLTRKKFDGARHNVLNVGQIGAGANMALRRSVIDLIGPFDEALDCGTLTRSGGDHDMFSRILKRGYRIVYEPVAINRHRHRRTWKELRNTIYGYGVGVYARLAKQLMIEGEPGALAIGWAWFRYDQLPDLLRSVRCDKKRKPLDLLLAELAGCAAGPWCYARARRLLRKENK